MDTDSFVIYIKTEDFYKDISNDVEKQFDTSNYDKNKERPLEIGVNKKVIVKFEDELGGKIMTEFIPLRAKTYAYLLDDDSEVKKAKGVRRCVINRILRFGNYRDLLFDSKKIMQPQIIFKSDHHEVGTKKVNRMVLSSNDDKRLQTFDRITTYPYGTNTFKVCESEMLVKRKAMPIKLYYNKI